VTHQRAAKEGQHEQDPPSSVAGTRQARPRGRGSFVEHHVMPRLTCAWPADSAGLMRAGRRRVPVGVSPATGAQPLPGAIGSAGSRPFKLAWPRAQSTRRGVLYSGAVRGGAAGRSGRLRRACEAGSCVGRRRRGQAPARASGLTFLARERSGCADAPPRRQQVDRRQAAP